MRLIVLSLMMILCMGAYAQTTFILVRHAEKGTDDPKNPTLSTEGQARAKSLSKLLEKQKIDAIYSTNYHRTKNTVAPVAEAKGITIETYDALKLDELITKHKGGTVLICGHSNTVPGFANTLLGGNQFANYDDADYGNVLIITATAVGHGTVTHLRY